MTRLPVLLAATLLVLPAAAEVERITRGNLVIEGIPEIPAELIERMRRYQNTRQATLAGWTAEGHLTISTRFGNAAQLHLVERPMGARRQITFFEEPIGNGAWSPTGARKGIAYLRDAGGNENFQLEYLDPTAGVPVRLTDGRGRAGGPVWSPDGTRVAFTWTARTGTNSDIYVDDPLDRRAPELVYEAAETGWNVAEWSPDGKSLLIARFVSVNETYGYVYDLESRKLREIEPSPAKAARFNAVFAHDGAGVYFTSDLGSEFQTLRHFDLATGKVTALGADAPWDVEDLAISRDGRYLAWVINEDGAGRLRLRDLRSGRDLAPPSLPFGVIGDIEFEPRGQRLAFSLQTPAAPFDVWTYSPADGELLRWTRSELGPLDAARFAAPSLVRFPTFDKDGRRPRQIPAWVYKPAGPGPHPVLINIHGGPEAQSRPIFSIATQQWVGELGYAVIAPNVRGSTGYGKNYVALDNGMKREDSVRDIGALLDWIATQPDLDASRVVVIGGSYGGYMVLASMTHYNDRLRGGIDIVGISNFVTFLESTAEYRRDLRRPEYGDERDPAMRAFFERISPLNNAGKIGKPMLIVQGQNDPRVPVTESEQMVAKIRANGGEVWYLLGLNEGHGFARRDNIDYYQWAVALFLEKLK
ncbi:MAG TPA: S9 family peptidase [Steroidobacteraceae bacterium]|nr:S9 family peptidase [Steroidobacteraceae bacterium]